MHKSRRGKCRPNELPWHSRHHVVSSRTNNFLPKTKRSYFDWLGGVRWKSGEFDDVLVSPPEIIGLKGHEEMLGRRFRQFPQFYFGRPCVERRQGVPTVMVEDALAQRVNKAIRGGARGVLPPGTMMQYLNSSDKKAANINVRDESSRNISDSADMVDQADVKDTVSDAASETPDARPSNDTKDTQPSIQVTMSTDSQPCIGRANSKRLWGIAKKQLEIQGETAVSHQFAEWCVAKHHHIVAVWRLLDSDHNMTVQKHEFMNGLKNLGYPHNLNELWRSLDCDHTGTLSFMEFAPEHSLDLARFKHWAETTFGSITNTFKALDTDGNGRLSFEEFNGACAMKGLPRRLQESIRMLFLLVDDPNDYTSRGSITADEMVFLDTWQCPLYLREKADIVGRAKLQNFLVERHGGNPLAAWRLELDKDSSMRVNFQEFTSACSRLAREGVAAANPAKGIPAVYCAFDRARAGWFSLEEWDKAAHDALSSVVSFVHGKYGKMSDFIRSLEEKPGSGVDLLGLRPGLRGSGIESDDIVLVYDGLAAGLSSGNKANRRRNSTAKQAKDEIRPRLHVQDILFLDKWNPGDEDEANKAWKGKALERMGTWMSSQRNSASQIPEELTDLWRQSSSGSGF